LEKTLGDDTGLNENVVSVDLAFDLISIFG
jgi:hypothetical protein